MTNQILEVAKQHFFLAMLRGWIEGNIKEMPGKKLGHREALYQEGDFRIVDHHCSDSPVSSGTTTIYHHGLPIWLMTYMGKYLQEDIPPLKHILRAVYERGEFIGGRGPRVCPLHPCFGTYENQVREGSCFSNFTGKEHISDSHGIRGHHEYWGRAII